ncbi:MAG: hypothetical protein MUC74_07435 [Ideonella sp.]|jgi:tungstate transport system substrate-binding protein|nr:hypothetical protein [Ideonella sp.]
MQSTDDFFHGAGRGPEHLSRRRWLRFAAAGAAALAAPAWATRVRSIDDPLLVGVDLDLQRSGLAVALQRAFARDAGIALRLEPSPAAVILERLERGELDAGLTNAAPAEQRLADQGLVHDRHRVATGRFVIVGPAAPPGATASPSPAAPAGRRVASAAADTDAVAWLQRLARDGAAADGPRFVSPQDGSGAHLAEQALWRAAGIGPQAPWYLRADPAQPLLAQARALGACALVDAALFAPSAANGLVSQVEHDPRLRFEVHVMRAFRVHHPAGQLFTRWVAGARGRRVVAAVRGYSAVRS